ncbi:MAG: glycerophosphodiester phosphodiesterase family protein [Pseudomonadota bacterium]
MGAREIPLKAYFREMANHPLIVVHRGLWDHETPENSLPAITGTVSAGLAHVEVDVRLSSDGLPMLIHDANLERTTGLSVPARELTLEQACGLPLRAGLGGPDAQMSAERLPSLEQALDCAAGALHFDLDVKDPGEVERVAACVAAGPWRERCSVKIDAETKEAVDRLQAMEATTGVMVMPKLRLEPGQTERQIALLASADVAVAEVYADRLAVFAEARPHARAAGITLWTYTLDAVPSAGIRDSVAATQPDRTWGALISAGIGAIMTDRAGALASYLSLSDNPRPFEPSPQSRAS